MKNTLTRKTEYELKWDQAEKALSAAVVSCCHRDLSRAAQLVDEASTMLTALAEAYLVETRQKEGVRINELSESLKYVADDVGASEAESSNSDMGFTRLEIL